MSSVSDDFFINRKEILNKEALKMIIPLKSERFLRKTVSLIALAVYFLTERW